MNLIFTMAGKYTRFRLFGNRIPKYLLPLGSETVLAEVLKNYIQLKTEQRIFLIANRDDQIFFPIVRSIMEKYGIDRKALLYIDETPSQLSTALTVSDFLPRNQQEEPIAFTNIDTILFGRQRFFDELNKLGFQEAILDTFFGDSNRYSYVRVSEKKQVLDIVDYNVISNLACSGLYGFGSFSKMEKIAKDLVKVDGAANFTSLYKAFVCSGLKVKAHHNDDANKTIVLGTPEEYLINIHRFR